MTLIWPKSWPTGRKISFTSTPGVLALVPSAGLMAEEIPLAMNRLSPQLTTWSPIRRLRLWPPRFQEP
ncbi:hypothetical protein D9M71_781890 [compost metagenome]